MEAGEGEMEGGVKAHTRCEDRVADMAGIEPLKTETGRQLERHAATPVSLSPSQDTHTHTRALMHICVQRAEEECQTERQTNR